MKKLALLVLVPALFVSAGCVLFPTVPKIGMKETSFLRGTIGSDLVYIDGSVKAYRSSGAYYYFRDGLLVKVGQVLLSADKI